MKTLILISAVALALAAVEAHATITINSISGVSNYTIQSNTTTSGTGSSTTTTTTTGSSGATVWGGMAGWDSTSTTTTPGPSCASTDSVVPCDSCANAVCVGSDGTTPLAPLCACNRARIYSSLNIGISVTQNQTPTYPVRAYAASSVSGTTGTELQLTGTLSATGVSFTWAQVCGLLGNIDCEQVAATTNAQATVSIYLDKHGTNQFASDDDHVDIKFSLVNPGRTDYNVFGNGASQGAGDFTPWPGDNRVYLKDLNTTSDFPNLAYGVQVQKLIIYLSKTSLAKANPKEKDVEGSLDIDNTGGVGENYIDDVENGTRYFMRIAMQDQGGNIVAFFPDLVGTDAKGVAHDAVCNTSPDDTCPFAVIPDQVRGILKNDFNCFIASAAYGTSMEPKLRLFRRFRNEVLLRYPLGRAFVWKYYAYGPYAARFIANKPVLRLMVRGVLWPLAGYSWLALKIGLRNSLLLCFAALMTLMSLLWIAARRARVNARV